MFKIDASWIIRGLYRKLLDRRAACGADGRFNGFVVSLNCSISNHRAVKTREDRRYIHIMICAPHHAFIYIPAHGDWNNNWLHGVPLDRWANVGNHESCWIDSVETALSQIYFDMCKHVAEDKPPASLSQFISFGLSDMWTEVKIRRSLIDSDLRKWKIEEIVLK